MSWQILQPSSAGELHQALVQLHENRSHVKSITVDHQNRMIKVDLDFLANTKVKDFMIPLKAGVTVEVDNIVKDLWAASKNNNAPGRAVADKIFEYLDTSPR